MFLRKLLVTVITCILAFILISTYLGLFITYFRETGLEHITDGFSDWLTLYLIFFVPVIFAYGLPVSILSEFLTKKMSGWKRMAFAYLIHIGFAAVTALFWPEYVFSVATIIIAAIFFIIDELVYSLQKKKKVQWKPILLAMILPAIITGFYIIPAINHEIQTDQEVARLDKEGFPEPVIIVDGEEYTDVKPMACWDNDDKERCGRDVYPLTSTNLYGSEGDIVVEPGDTLNFTFENSPEEPEIQISYWKNDEIQKTMITDGQWVVPNEPGMYGYGINADWTDMSLGFSLNIEVKEQQ
ncbi:hypothetical protein ACSVDE_02100 [Pseudalkalibacillus sp. Hm43]|uniref:hypothetical protein n=1 Tax=Pseudalkalibacillus sp. Hm43 TaxID=3450742 RepID=UPI003F442912